MGTKINIDKFVVSIIEAFPAFKEEGRIPCMYAEALGKQGLMYENGRIVNIPFRPKFKAGDWITDGVGRHLVTGMDLYNNLYSFDEEQHALCFSYVDREYHLWTIKDARPGDVLSAEDGWTCIFKKLKGEQNFSSYCFMDSGTYFFDEGSEVHTLDKRINGEMLPANEERREIFFSKMKEAGYEWDAEKLTLKKIEDNDIERKKEALLQKKRMDIQTGVCCPNLMTDNYIQAYREGIDAAIDHILHLRPQNTWKPSDAQMASITCAVRKMKESACYDSELVSLYQDLKKLKG